MVGMVFSYTPLAELPDLDDSPDHVLLELAVELLSVQPSELVQGLALHSLAVDSLDSLLLLLATVLLDSVLDEQDAELDDLLEELLLDPLEHEALQPWLVVELVLQLLNDTLLSD